MEQWNSSNGTYPSAAAARAPGADNIEAELDALFRDDPKLSELFDALQPAAKETPASAPAAPAPPQGQARVPGPPPAAQQPIVPIAPMAPVADNPGPLPEIHPKAAVPVQPRITDRQLRALSRKHLLMMIRDLETERHQAIEEKENLLLAYQAGYARAKRAD